MGSPAINYNDTLPAAPSGSVNNKWQTDASASPVPISTYTPPMTSTEPGAVPTPPNDATKVLRGDATWGAPPAASLTLEELTDVAITSPSDGDMVVWNAATSKWVKALLVAGTNVTITNDVDSSGEIIISAAGGGGGGGVDAISVAFNARPSTVDLTTEGTLDWWYANGQDGLPVDTLLNPSSKVLGGESIKVRMVGSNSPGTYGDSATSLSWAAGDSSTSPIAGSGQNTGIFNSGGAGYGFSVAAPADTYQRVLRIYMGSSSGTFAAQAVLSDGGAPYGPTTPGSGSGLETYMIEITYTAEYDGQQLIFSFIEGTAINCFILAVTLGLV